MPLDAQEAGLLVELEAAFTLEELDEMPQSLIDVMILYRMVKNAILTGKELIL